MRVRRCGATLMGRRTSVVATASMAPVLRVAPVDRCSASRANVSTCKKRSSLRVPVVEDACLGYPTKKVHTRRVGIAIIHSLAMAAASTMGGPAGCASAAKTICACNVARRL